MRVFPYVGKVSLLRCEVEQYARHRRSERYVVTVRPDGLARSGFLKVYVATVEGRKPEKPRPKNTCRIDPDWA